MEKWKPLRASHFSTPLVICSHPRLRGWRFGAQRGVWSDGVVVDAPALSQHTQFFDRVEDLSVEELISEFGVERFAVAVLPGRAGFDIQRFGSRVLQPFAQI